MAFEAAWRTFNTGTGTSDINLDAVIGFTPKAIIFFGNKHPGSTDGATAGHGAACVGIAVGDGAGDQVCVTGQCENASSKTDSDRYYDTAQCFTTLTTTGGIDGQLSVKSGGFVSNLVLQVDNAFGTDRRGMCLCLGGSDLTVTLTETTAATGSGNQDIGVSQDTDVLFAVSHADTAQNSRVTDNILTFGWGFSSTSTDQAVWAGGSNHNDANASGRSYARDGQILALLDDGAQSVERTATYEGVPSSNNVRLAWSGTGSADRIALLSLAGISGFIAEDAFETDTSTTMVFSGAGFQPSCGMAVGCGHPNEETTTTVAIYRWMIGGWDSTSSRGALTLADADGGASSACANGQDNDGILLEHSATGTVTAIMDIDSVDSDGATYIMDDAAGVAKYYWTVMLGLAAAGGTTYNVDLSDSLTLTENLIRTGVYNRANQDDLTLTEALVRTGIFDRSAADAFSLTDNLFRSGVFLRTPSDPLTLTENLQRTGIYERTVSDALTLSESLVRTGVYDRTLADAMTLTDNLIRSFWGIRLLNEALSLTENLSYGLSESPGTRNRTVSDSLTLTENLLRTGVFTRAVNDVLNLTETVVREGADVRVLRDDLTLTENLKANSNLIRQLLDSLTITENLVRSKETQATPSDNLGFTENLIRTGVFTRNVRDNLNLTENFDFTFTSAPPAAPPGRHWRYWLWLTLRRQKPWQPKDDLWA